MTAEELCALPDKPLTDIRLIRGRLVERPHTWHSPAHSSALTNLYAAFGEWLAARPDSGLALYGYGCPYRLQRHPDTLVCYDASVVQAPLGSRNSRGATF